MAASSILGLRQLSISAVSTCWKVPQRNISKERAVLKKLGYPEKPKRPLTGFLCYISSNRATVAARNPNKSFAEISVLLSKQWKELADGEKQKYLDTYNKQAVEYKAKMEEYNKLLTDKQRKEIKEVLNGYTISQKEKGIRSEVRKLEKQLNKPKSPVSPFFVYYVRNSDSFQGQPATVAFKLIAEQWKNAPESEKQKYKVFFNKEYEQYKKNLEKWEEQMMQQGNLDMIRLKTLKEKLKGSKS